MHYRHSLQIHQRLHAVLQLIETGRYSTPALAQAIGVSIPTISRIVAALREQGHDIRAEKHAHGWRYVRADKPDSGKNRANASNTTSSPRAF